MDVTVAEAAPTLASVRGALVAFGQSHPEITRLAVFGSVARGEATPESDVDVAVNFTDAWKQAIGGFEYFGHLDDLESELLVRLGKPAHLVENGPRMSNQRLSRVIARDRRIVYETADAATRGEAPHPGPPMGDKRLMNISQRQADALGHILDCCRRAIQWSASLEREQYEEDSSNVYALVRCVEVIGEAATRLGPAFHQAHPEVPWQRLTGMRNRLIHGYDKVNREILHETVTLDVPELRTAVEAILRAEGLSVELEEEAPPSAAENSGGTPG